MISQLLLLIIFTICNSFIPHATHIVMQEQNKYNNILIKYNIPCHSQSSRIKTFSSIIHNMERKNISNIFSIHDLIGFRYIFYNTEDLYKFYHYVCHLQKVTYCKNYILNPKINGYKAIHLRYKNIYTDLTEIENLECQLFILKDYYDSLYGKSQYIDKNYHKLYLQ